MADPSIQYTKFPAKHKKFIGSDRIWFGQDHLLLVSSTGISEDYKRFYYKDIQALNVMKTNRRMIYLIITFCLLTINVALTVWIYRMDNQNPEVLVPGSIVGAVLIGYLVWLFIKGPFCKTYIYSSVQKENLTPLKTVKKSERFLNILLPEIKAIQGDIEPEMLSSQARRATAAPSAILKHAKTATKKVISPFWHRVLFLSLMGLGVIMTTLLLYRSPVLYAVSGFVLLLILLTNTAALVKQAGSTLSSKAKTITITSMVFLVLTVGCGYIEFVFFMFKNMETWVKSSQNQWELTKLYAQINPFDYPVILGIDIFLIAAFFILGLTGLIVIWRPEKTNV